MEYSKVSSKYQATIPLTVRQALGIKRGDLIAYEIDNGEVKLRRVTPADVAYSRAVAETLSEWNTETDDDAYRDL